MLSVQRRRWLPPANLLPFVVALIQAGCGSGRQPQDEILGSVREIADTVIFTTQRPSRFDTAHLVHVARIGRFDGPEDHLLFGSLQFTVGWRGEVYVADEGGGIRVFSFDGSEVRRIARRGGGPGETIYVTGLEVDQLGRLLAVDYGNRRVAVFDTAGAVLDHWPLPHGRPGYGRSAVIPIPEHQTLLPLNPPLNPSGGPPGFPRPIFVRLDSAGVVLDTVFAPVRLNELCPYHDDPYFSAGFWQDYREPMYPKVKWTGSRSGEVILGCSAKYEVDRVQPDGRVFRVSHEREPMIEPGEVRDRFVAEREIANRLGNPGWRWRGPPPPEQKPYYHRFIMGRGGRLWVWPGHLRKPRPSSGLPKRTVWEDPNTGAFDVFDPDGDFLGPVPLPEGAEFEWFPGEDAPFFAGDTVWLVRRDSIDVKYIDRMVIHW